MSSTPLLDRVTPLPAPLSPGRGSRLVFAVGLAVGLSVALVLASADPPQARVLIHALRERFPGLFTARPPVVLLSVVMAMVAVVVVHECGHVVAGLLAGFRFNTIAIGFLRIDDRFRVSLHLGTLAWSGGWVGMLPAVRTGLRWRAIVLAAGGPFTSVAAGVIGLWFAGGGPGSAMFVIGCLASIGDLLPVRAGAVAFDGWRLVRLLRDDAWSRRWLALMTVTVDFRNGVPPDELPAPVLDALTAHQDASVDTSVAYAVAYSASFYSGDEDRSARLLETALRFSGHVAPPFRAALIRDAAVFQGRRRRRADLAEAWTNDLPADAQAWLRTRAEAAALQARGEPAAAAAKLEACERAIAGVPMPTEEQRRMAIRLLGRWKAELPGVS